LPESGKRLTSGVLIDVTSDSPQFAALAGLVRRGGTAVTIRFVADQQRSPELR